MIPNNSPFSKIDPDAERRRILAKVYSLLIRLAEASENKPTVPDLVGAEIKIEEPNSARPDPSTKEVNS